MSIKKREHIKNRAAYVALKAATVATLITGTGVVSSCAGENNERTDDNKDKIENVEAEKTSVVFRSTHNSYRLSTSTDILFENGDEISAYKQDRFLEPGDTVTYEITDKDSKTGNIKAVRYKNGTGKNVNFGKIGKSITD